MSYSRWGGKGSGYWYTFWHVQDEEIENRDTAIFCICSTTFFSAKQLRDNLDECMQKVNELEKGEGDLEELKVYVAKFLDDVDGAYPI